MQDEPTAPELLAVVADFLRTDVLAAVPKHMAFHVRVAANAIDLARREIEQRPAADAAERARLVALLGHDGDTADLNAELAAAIRARKVDASTPGLIDHLWAATLEKVAVDQPNYSAYLRATES